jgi:rubrerythrin
MKFDSVDAVLDFAISKEEDAAQYHTDLAERMDKPHMKEIFEQFALEEKSHKAKLELVKKGKLLLSAEKKILNLKIVDSLKDNRFQEGEFNYQDALMAAMNAEKTSFKLYTDLAEAVDKPELKETFLALAQEEAKHKLRFELEYDEEIYQEN